MLIVCAILAQSLLILCGLFGAVLWMRREQARLEERIRSLVDDWVMPQAEGRPSKFAEVLEAVGSVVGSSVARSIMASLNADASHVARVANGAVDGLQVQSNPLLAMLGGGKRGKGAAIARLAEMLGPMLAGKNGSAASAGGEYTGRRHKD